MRYVRAQKWAGETSFRPPLPGKWGGGERPPWPPPVPTPMSRPSTLETVSLVARVTTYMGCQVGQVVSLLGLGTAVRPL